MVEECDRHHFPPPLDFLSCCCCCYYEQKLWMDFSHHDLILHSSLDLPIEENSNPKTQMDPPNQNSLKLLDHVEAQYLDLVAVGCEVEI